MNEQVIVTPNGERLVVIPEARYVAMMEALEDRQDGETVSAFRARMAVGEEELVPANVVKQLLEGENPVRVWRMHRGMTARALAAATSLSAPYISEIEGGKKEASLATMKRIAEALDVELTDIA